ncbi:FecCD family ABC transporter permease [Actinokineospora iranica]|uniref:Iron complex transport system permease protein n=1 Tax=Actinokineospora iranica TaxID=1271860 RepID=A0A1G6T9W3_9PSEU|nr:iron chelate uptake ABC transporter family permease subunit [Actinokineospora iranica]SDD25115.1 iron complex transport system permease protein [Actinokineospora iranica]
MLAQTRPVQARRRLPWLIAAMGVLVLVTLLSIMVGSKHIPLLEVLRLLGSAESGEDAAIVNGMRLSRTLFGLAVGVSLGLAGALMQGLTRNPLADPGLLGVGAGAALGVVLTTSVFGVTALFGYIWFAFAGAMAATVVVYVLGSLGRGGANPAKLALAGAAVSALLQSVISMILLLDSATLDDYRFWAVGSLNVPDSSTLLQVLPFLVLGVVLAAVSAPGLNILALGDDVARALGQNVLAMRLLGAVAITLLAGGATAVCGPIAFLGLVVPHIARMLTGPDQRWVLAYSAVLAPTLLLAADVLGRVIADRSEVHVGIVVAFLGAPFFIALVRRRKLPEL